MENFVEKYFNYLLSKKYKLCYYIQRGDYMEQAYALLNNVKSALKEELNNSVYNNSFADLNKIHKVQNGNIYLIVTTKLE